MTNDNTKILYFEADGEGVRAESYAYRCEASQLGLLLSRLVGIRKTRPLQVYKEDIQ